MAGSFWHRRRGSGEKLWRGGDQFQNSSLKFAIVWFAAKLFACQSQKRGTPTDGFEQYHAFSNKSQDLQRHTEETKAQSSIHDCTADQEMSCWACTWSFFIQAGARFVCNFMPSHPTPRTFASLAKASPIGSASQMQTWSGFRGGLKTEGKMRKALCACSQEKLLLFKKSRRSHAVMRLIWRGMRRDQHFPLHSADTRRIQY